MKYTTGMRDIRAISRPSSFTGWLALPNQPIILHIFDEACNLINERRDVLSIVHAEIGNGPFNLVLEEPVLFTKHLDAESKVTIHDEQILLGDITISLTDAQTWNPVPKWDELRKHKNEIVDRLTLLQIDNENETILQFSNSLSLAIINEDISTAKNVSSKLAGLGIGLTPAGDDFLMGAMYAAWMIHPQEAAREITEQIANAAVPLTTSLSGAWLRAAAQGEAGVLWHEFFDTLIEDKNIYLPMSKILSVGETSGSDALAGFLETISCWRQS